MSVTQCNVTILILIRLINNYYVTPHPYSIIKYLLTWSIRFFFFRGLKFIFFVFLCFFCLFIDIFILKYCKFWVTFLMSKIKSWKDQIEIQIIIWKLKLYCRERSNSQKKVFMYWRLKNIISMWSFPGFSGL